MSPEITFNDINFNTIKKEYSPTDQRLEKLFESVVREVKVTAVLGAANRQEERKSYKKKTPFYVNDLHNGYYYLKDQNGHWLPILTSGTHPDNINIHNFNSFCEDLSIIFCIIANAYLLEHYRSGQCHDQAAYAAYLLWQYANAHPDSGIQQIELCAIENLDHIFLIVNRDPNSNPSDPTTWGGWIIDPWEEEGHRFFPCNRKNIGEDLQIMVQDVLREEIYSLFSQNPLYKIFYSNKNSKYEDFYSSFPSDTPNLDKIFDRFKLFDNAMNYYLNKIEFPRNDPLFKKYPYLLIKRNFIKHKNEINKSFHIKLDSIAKLSKQEMQEIPPPNLHMITMDSDKDRDIAYYANKIKTLLRKNKSLITRENINKELINLPRDVFLSLSDEIIQRILCSNDNNQTENLQLKNKDIYNELKSRFLNK